MDTAVSLRAVAVSGRREAGGPRPARRVSGGSGTVEFLRRTDRRRDDSGGDCHVLVLQDARRTAVVPSPGHHRGEPGGPLRGGSGLRMEHGPPGSREPHALCISAGGPIPLQCQMVELPRTTRGRSDGRPPRGACLERGRCTRRVARATGEPRLGRRGARPGRDSDVDAA